MGWKRANPELRLKPLLEILPEKLNSGIWLDVGTGDGFFSKLMQQLHPNNTFIRSDISNRANYGDLGFKSSIEHLGIRENSLSGIICSQVLHYFDYRRQKIILEVLNSFLINGGILLIVEYSVNRDYSWIPYPLSLRQLTKYANSNEIWSDIQTKSIQDGRRPKYSLLLHKQNHK